MFIVFAINLLGSSFFFQFLTTNIFIDDESNKLADEDDSRRQSSIKHGKDSNKMVLIRKNIADDERYEDVSVSDSQSNVSVDN